MEHPPASGKSAKAETLRLPEHRDLFYGGEWHQAEIGRCRLDQSRPRARPRPRAPTAAPTDIDAASAAAAGPASTAGATCRRSSAPRRSARMAAVLRDTPTSSR